MKNRRGFTLVELLAVMGIIVLLVGLMVPKISSILDANQMTQATQSLASAFSTARQVAFTRNNPAVLRLYRYADPTRAGEVAGNPSTGRYRAFQVFVNLGKGSLTPVQRLTAFPVNVVINSGSYSTLLTGTGRSDATPGTSDASVPSVGASYLYQDLIINPGGSVLLSSGTGVKPWSLTLEIARAKDTDPLPANFASLVLNPLNATVRVYRP